MNKKDVNININYYAILELDIIKNISETDIEFKDKRNAELNKIDNSILKKKYRELSKKFHPDKQDGIEETFKNITIAYNILSNVKLKEYYDESSKYGLKYDEANELYNFDFSKTSTRKEHYNNKFKKYKKELIDILLKIPEYMEEITYTRNIFCKKCEGNGTDFSKRYKVISCSRCEYYENDLGDDICRACNGAKKVTQHFVLDCDMCSGDGEFMNKKCAMCQGKGEISLVNCKKCDGNKMIEIRETIKLDKKLFEENEGKICFKNKGNASKDELGKVGSLWVMLKGSE